MRKCLKRIGFCAFIACMVWVYMIAADRQTLRQELIRFHVVAASDAQEDQALKLQVRDAVVSSLRRDMDQLTDTQQAKAYLQENLPKIEALANRVLRAAGSTDLAVASLKTEEFPTRCYDTFTLPAGVYDALRITIGEGEGHNWWCVVFPALCVGATVEEFEESAQCSGLSDGMITALSADGDYEVRFFVLDAIGRLENFLHKE